MSSAYRQSTHPGQRLPKLCLGFRRNAHRSLKRRLSHMYYVSSNEIHNTTRKMHSSILCVCVCLYPYKYKYDKYLSTYIHTYINPCIHTSMHTNIHTCIHFPSIRPSIHPAIHPCIHTYICVQYIQTCPNMVRLLVGDTDKLNPMPRPNSAAIESRHPVALKPKRRFGHDCDVHIRTISYKT